MTSQRKNLSIHFDDSPVAMTIHKRKPVVLRYILNPTVSKTFPALPLTLAP